MLVELEVRELALVEAAQVTFGPGLNLLIRGFGEEDSYV